MMRQVPLYTCLETIQRNRPKSHDVVQVEVGVAGTHEMYSWPGAANFSSTNLPDLVVHGMLSTGMFSGFARNIFVGGSASVHLTGTEVLQGRQALHFAYQVPSLQEQWTINWDGQAGELQEAGEFWVDATDYHLLRLLVVAQDIPPNLLLRSLRLILNYGIFQSNGYQVLLPDTGDLTAVDMRRRVFHNIVAFSHCHVFAAESKVSSDEPAMASTLTGYQESKGVLPPNLTLRVALTEPVTVRTARVGDLVTARLESPVQLSSVETIPAGAILKGRLRQFASLDEPPRSYEVGLAFSELVYRGRSYDFFAELSCMEELPGIKSELPRDATSVLLSLKIPGSVSFFLSGRTELPEGFRMTWKTRVLRRSGVIADGKVPDH